MVTNSQGPLQAPPTFLSVTSAWVSYTESHIICVATHFLLFIDLNITMHTSADRSKAITITTWVFQIIGGLILLQASVFKFIGAPETVQIFTLIGVEPWGRLLTGIAEVGAGAMLLIPRTAALGAALAVGIISGAIVSHLTVLGIAIEAIGDSGEMFGMALAVFVSSLVVLIIRRRELPILGEKLS